MAQPCRFLNSFAQISLIVTLNSDYHLDWCSHGWPRKLLHWWATNTKRCSNWDADSCDRGGSIIGSIVPWHSFKRGILYLHSFQRWETWKCGRFSRWISKSQHWNGFLMLWMQGLDSCTTRFGGIHNVWNWLWKCHTRRGCFFCWSFGGIWWTDRSRTIELGSLQLHAIWFAG